MTHHVSIDIETRSGVDIRKAGAYKYALSPDFRIMLFAYKIDEEPVEVLDLTSRDQLPADVASMLRDPDYVKHAYNAAFEWWCLARAGYTSPLDQWRCTMAQAMYCGFPAGLSATGEAVGLPQEKKKLSTGSALIRYFCNPHPPTRTTKKAWRDPEDAPERWQLFKEYNAQDVEAEHAIWRKLRSFPMPEAEECVWRQTVLMNAKGARVDRTLVSGARSIDAECRRQLMDEAMRITGVNNPNSTVQLMQWLEDEGAHTENLRKDTIKDLLSKENPLKVRRMLEIRQMLGKTSVKKYDAMASAMCEDDRIRGLMQHYGAGTGRWAGRLVQVQNLPRNYMKTLESARRIVRSGNLRGLQLIYGDVQDVLSQLIRTAFIPSDGHKLIVADFSAIEARMIAWLANETWANEVFATHGKIYEATAAQMFHVPIETIAKGEANYDLRQKGKVATLALGYQGGPAALTAMGALQMGIPEEELPEIVTKWRNANPNIVQFWRDVEDAAAMTVETGAPGTVRIGKPEDKIILCFRMEGDLIEGISFLTIQLPSGRKLFYPRPFLEENRFGRQAVHFYSLGANKKWGIDSTYGGKLVENITQAIARDCLAVSLQRIQERAQVDCFGSDPTVFHVHDEVVLDAPMDWTADEICALMGQSISWAPGLILKAAGFESQYYMKD